MSIEGFLKKQAEASIGEGRTRPVIRRLVLRALEVALVEHYGTDYSSRCMQSASAVVELLKRCGIDSLLVQGEACIGQVFGSRLGWTTFGGEPERMHFWTRTQFGELVDFTVSQHNLAPGVEPGGVPCPALWWDDANQMPGAFCYLPGPARGRLVANLADADEQEHFRRFLKGAEDAFDRGVEAWASGPNKFEVVSSVDDLNRLNKEGDRWAGAAWRFQDLPLPDWARRRAEELARASQRATSSPRLT